MEKQATLKEKFSAVGYWTAGRSTRRVSGEGGIRCALSKAEFMEKVQQSNEACQRGDFQAAVRLYTNTLQADPQNCILYSNRAAALLKLGQHQAALDDALKACELNPKWPKGFILFSAQYCAGPSHLGAWQGSSLKTWMSPELAQPGFAARKKHSHWGNGVERRAACISPLVYTAEAWHNE